LIDDCQNADTISLLVAETYIVLNTSLLMVRESIYQSVCRNL